MLTFHLVVMGVSGCGKTSVAAALAKRLGLVMVDGDDLHTPESVAKMRSGIPLDDTDRWPWLDRIGAYLAQGDATHTGRIVACSALKRAYRDRLRQHTQQLYFVFLDGSDELIRKRLVERKGHYMHPELLDSQLRTLERPQPDEHDIICLNISASVDALADQALQVLQSLRAQTPRVS